MNDYVNYTSSDYVEALDYAIDILEALDFENVLAHGEAKHNISILQDLKGFHNTSNLPK